MFQDAQGQWYDDSYNPISDPTSYNSPYVPTPPQTTFTNTSTVKPSVPNGVPDPAHPGYDTNGYLLGATNNNGNITIPNKVTGNTSTFNTSDPFGTLSFRPNDPTAPPPPLPPGGQTGTLTDPTYYAPFTGTAPTFNYKQFVAPPNFVAPTADEAANEDGYKFVVQQGDDAIMNNAAAQGLARSAGTVKGLSDYNRNAAATQYGNVYARAFGTYQGMVNNLLAEDQQDFSHADSAYQDSMKEFLANRDTFYGNQTNPFNKLYSLASLGVTANAA